MKKVILVISCILLSSTSYLYAQFFSNSTYPLTISTTSSLYSNTGFTQLIGSNVTNVQSALTSFGSGFTFTFSGVNYSSFTVSSSGWVRLGSSGSSQPNANLLSTTNMPIIAPLWMGMSTSSTGSVGYKIIGNAPYRICVIQWYDVTGSFIGPITFQLTLHESSGKLEFIYGGITGIYSVLGYACGFASQINNVSNLCSVTLNATITNSTVSYMTANNSNQINIPAGTSFIFTPDSNTVNVPMNLQILRNSTCMTLFWNDNSSNEDWFVLQKSTDSINYSDLSFIPSTSKNTTNTTYSYIDMNITPSSRYHYRVIAYNLATVPLGWSSSSDTTISAPLISGLKTIPGDYPSIGVALSDINCKGLTGPVVLELQSNYNSQAEVFPLNLPSDMITSPLNTLTIRPAANASNLSIDADNATATFNFNNSSNITIDGRAGGTGSTIELSITNSSNAAPVFKFINDSRLNTIQYCDIIGSNSQNGNGLIYFGGTSLALGNDSIRIENNSIHGNLSSRPKNIIYSNGNSIKKNSNIVISDNNIYDYGNSLASSQGFYGLNILNGNEDWLINGNSFYHTVSPVIIGADFYGISIIDTAENFTITNNYFGGTLPQASGAHCVISGTNKDITWLYIESHKSSIQGNTFRNFNIQMSSVSTQRMIWINQGHANVGTITGNTIGSKDSTASIISNVGGSLLSIGIRFTGYNKIINVHNNIIGGIEFGGAGNLEFHGISLSGDDSVTVINNLIGSNSVQNSITSGLSVNGTMSGIGLLPYAGPVLINNNTIANISHLGSVANGSGNAVVGISKVGGTVQWGPPLYVEVRNNKVFDLTTAAPSSLIGIHYGNSNGSLIVSGNLIYGLKSTNPSSFSANGLYVASASDTYTKIFNNFIHSIYTVNSNCSYQIKGLYIYNGYHNIYNNMIRLGIDANGNSVTGDGITYAFLASGTKSNILFNTISIGGDSVINSGGFSTALFASGIDSVYNNIICNNRSSLVNNSSYHHFCVEFNNTNIKSDYNLFYHTGNQSCLGRITTSLYPTFALWQTWQIFGGAGKDPHSYFGDPNFINPLGDTSNVNLHLQQVTLAEGMGLNFPIIVTDIDGDIRNNNTPVDVGADAGNFINILTSIPPDKLSEKTAFAYPNPFSYSTTIILPKLTNIQEAILIITDATGKKVFEMKNINSSEISINHIGLKSGIYFYSVINIDKKKWSGALIVAD